MPQIWQTTKACDFPTLKASNQQEENNKVKPKKVIPHKANLDLAKKNKDKQRSWQVQHVDQKDDQGPYLTVLEITSHNLKPEHAEARLW